MSLPYKKILVIGATSGIGYGLATKFLENNMKVVVVGRRQEKLDEFVSKNGSVKASAEVFDITDLDRIPKFVNDITSKHPDIDAVVLNSGLQRGFDFSKPETVDLGVFDKEWQTNYTSYIYLTKAFLPYLQGKSDREVALMYMSSGLALCPIMTVPGYCATKAALHSFILVLREQLKAGSSHLKVIEMFPPAVQTELHGWMATQEQKTSGMPLGDFIQETWEGLVEGKDQIPVGKSKLSFDRFESAKQAMFGQVVDMMKRSS